MGDEKEAKGREEMARLGRLDGDRSRGLLLLALAKLVRVPVLPAR